MIRAHGKPDNGTTDDGFLDPPMIIYIRSILRMKIIGDIGINKTQMAKIGGNGLLIQISRNKIAKES